jgi:hypothetical protein
MSLDERALDLLEAGYRHSEWYQEGEAKRRLVFRDSDAANDLELTTAERDIPQARTYHRLMGILVNSGAVVVPAIRAQGFVGVTFYGITPEGIAMLREAGRIA